MARACRAAAVLAGCVVMAYGAWGLFLSHAVPHTANLLAWLAASVLGHDGVIAPAVFALCWAGTRLLPPWAKPWAAGALLAGGTVFLVGLATVLAQGRDSNPTVLPLDYGRNILVVLLAVIAAAAAAAGGTSAMRAARRSLRPRHATAPHGAAGQPHGVAGREHHEDRKNHEERKHQENRAHHTDRGHRDRREDDAADPAGRQQGNDSDERQL